MGPDRPAARQDNILNSIIKGGLLRNTPPCFIYWLTYLWLFMIKNSINMSEKEQKKVDKRVKKFMKSVRAFLVEKSGSVRPEWECSLLLLETYLEEFMVFSIELEKLESIVTVGRNGEQPHSLFGARDKAAVRIEGLLKSLGCTFKEAAKMEVIEPVAEDSALDSYLKNKIEKR